MLGALIIVFREVIEAGLIVGIVWAVASNLAAARAWILSGAAAGLAGSALVAAFTGAIASAFDGYGQEIFNACILGTAVIMLAWHNIWMARHGRRLAMELHEAGQEAISGKRSLFALAFIVCMAVMREGSEVVLFLYGIIISNGATGASLFVGGLLGLGAGLVVSVLTFKGLLTIPMRHFFTVTNWLVTLLAAGMASQLVGYLQQAGIITVLDETVWDTSAILSESSVVGRVLHTLIGYADQPTAIQVIAYVAVIAFIWSAARLLGDPTPARPSKAVLT